MKKKAPRGKMKQDSARGNHWWAGVGEGRKGMAEMEALRERQDAGWPHGAESQNQMEQKHRQKAGKRTGIDTQHQPLRGVKDPWLH